MNNSMKNSGLHGGSDSRSRAPAATDFSPGKRTLTESIHGAPALSADLSASASASTVALRTAPAGSSPALSAFSVGSVADSFASSGSGVASEVGGSLPAVQRKSAADVAEGGFGGGGHEVPHRAQMEQSFGMDFGGVRAHSDTGAAKANDTLGSHAYAMGNQVAFKSASPSPALVAHELTHVVQQTQGPSYKADGSVDTSGEAEANAVESAVAAGRPAHTALRSVSTSGGPGLKKIGAGPALRKRGPALEGGGEGGGSKFGMGMTFSLEGFEKSYDYTIWKGHYAWPIGIPGINFVIDPNVKVSGKGQAKWGGEAKGDIAAQLGVFGECGIGLSGGIPDVAEIYGTVNPGIEGAFTLTKHAEHKEEHKGGEHAEGGEHAGGEHAGGESKGPASTWSLVGAIGLKAAVKVGVSLAGGIVDQAFELGSIEVCKLTGVYFDQTGFRSDKLGFEWGEKMKGLFDSIKRAIDKAKNLGKAAIEAAKNAGGAIAKKASSFGHWLTSW